MGQYPRGSEWRKWDLHVHTPKTKLNDQYKDEQDVWEQFIQEIENSDVSVFGITDYFSIDNYSHFISHFKNTYPQSNKVFFPNIEFRLDTNNKDGEHINIHVLFDNQDETIDKINNSLSRLPIVATDDDSGTQKHCTSSDLQYVTYEKAMVQTDSLWKYLGDNFKKSEYCIVGVARGYGSIRPGTDGRGAQYAKELDKQCEFFFGNHDDRDFFLNKKEGREQYNLPPKAVLSGSDAHSFETLNSTDKITWIKADPTFEGLKQVIYEPEERVRIQETSPGEKPLDRVISKIQFNNAFSILPQEITFNENLCSIIGSRSSGKSSLLAYLAYGINNEETKQKIGGPAPAIKWEDLDFDITVIWTSGDSQENAKITYIPQNYLYEYCQDNNHISSLIRDTVFYDTTCELQKKYDNVKERIKKYNRLIEEDIDKYIKNIQNIQSNKELMKNEGSQETLNNLIEQQQKKKAEIEEKSNLSDEDKENLKTYQKEKQELEQKDEELNKIYQQISQFIHDDESINFDINIYTNPDINKLPQDISSDISQFIQNKRNSINQHVQDSIMKKYKDIKKKKNDNQKKKNQLTQRYKEIIEKIKSLQSLEKINQELYDSKTRLQNIKSYQQIIDDYVNHKQDIITNIKNKINDKHEILTEFKESSIPSKQGVYFTIEVEYSEEQYDELTQLFNLGIVNQYIDDKKKIKLTELLENPHDFLNTMYSEENSTQILKKNVEKNDAIKKILTTDKEIRFVGEVEETRIGGFSESSMTDGEKALFALRLLLDDSSGAWPLLIDQPEDDLDSRSIYDEIVPFLKEQKQKRQIIMVSHNANLVVGSDSEQVIVANKHSSSKPNKDEQTLDYLTGSLEMSQEEDSSQDEYLKRRGIREHTCHILDGGTEAFNKRKKKYNIS